MIAVPQQTPVEVVRAALLSNLEYLFTSPLGIGVTTATPLQRALCRIIQGVPLRELKSHPDVLEAIGDIGAVDGVKPAELDIYSGIRTAKSMIAAAVAIFATQNCDLSILQAGEIPRFPIVSLAKDNADVVHQHIAGTIKSSPVLASLLLEEPTTESIMLRGKGGRPIEIAVVAGARAGGSLVSRWLIGVLFDEAPRMAGNDAVVNLADQQESVRGRLLPGAQLLRVGSPWAPFGVSYEAVKNHWKKPTRERVVMKARADKMNPVWWTEERMTGLKRRDPGAYKTDVEAEFRDLTESNFTEAAIKQCTREGPMALPPEPRQQYSATIDPATRSNAFTFTIGTRKGAKRIVAYHRQWMPQPGIPLKTKVIAKEIAGICKSYRIDTIITDQWSSDVLKEIFEEAGITLVEHRWTSKQTVDAFTKTRDKMDLAELELPPDEQFAEDLKQTKRVTTQAGISIVLPKTADGRHCDFAPALARLVAHWVDDEAEDVPQQGTPERARYDEAEREKQEDTEFERRSQRPWFRGGPLHGRSLTRR